MKPIIRLATETDAAALADLRWEFRAEDGEPARISRDQFRLAYVDFFLSGIREQTRAHFVADVDENLVGHLVVQRVAMVPRPKRVHDEWGYVTDNYVKPAFRNEGIGAALLQAAIAWSREQDFELLIVWPSDDAVTHYRRAGFASENSIMELSLRDY
jgi:GNAT superfamily N-acetyltransferase